MPRVFSLRSPPSDLKVQQFPFFFAQSGTFSETTPPPPPPFRLSLQSPPWTRILLSRQAFHGRAFCLLIAIPPLLLLLHFLSASSVESPSFPLVEEPPPRRLFFPPSSSRLSPGVSKFLRILDPDSLNGEPAFWSLNTCSLCQLSRPPSFFQAFPPPSSIAALPAVTTTPSPSG